MDFIFILQIMKRKSDIVDVAADKEIWRADGFTQFGLVEAIYKLKIPGFSSEFLQMKKSPKKTRTSRCRDISVNIWEKKNRG